MNLAKFPRTTLAHLPTPIEFLPRFSEALDGPDIYMKRDDLTGLCFGGNKTRKLEFLMAEAIAQGADSIITQGATQSNHVRQTIAAAAKLGFHCEVLLENRTQSDNSDYLNSGNVFLDHLMGATIHHVARDTDMSAAMQQHADKLRHAGKKPYIIPGGGSNTIGALGYVNCVIETVEALNRYRIDVDAIVVATGSTGTQAGLVAGLEAMNSNIPLLGISVRAERQVQEENVYKLACATADLLALRTPIRRENVIANSDYVGAGYGMATEGMIEAVKMMAQTEGIMMDPVYSGKALAGLIDLIRQQHFTKGQKILFIHTGGNTALFGYLDTFHNR